MAGAEGTLLFHRGKEDGYDSDIWDDTALIAAYDAAVAPLKAKLAEHTGDASVLEGTKRPPASGQSKKKRNKKKKGKQSKKNQKAEGWSVGDYCQAVFTEDGVIYEAKVVSISAEEGTCVVRYLGYGNEEEQSLEDLIQPERLSRKERRSLSVSQSETESVSSASRHVDKKASPSKRPWQPSYPSFPTFTQGATTLPPPPPSAPTFFPMAGHPMFGGMPPPPPPPHMGSAASMPFPMMPPPPPPMPNDSVSNENEALCSMLLSWYMSGYHTGYYQGLKQGRQQDASAAMGPSR